MGHTNDQLSAVRAQIDADDGPLKEARARLELVRDIVEGFYGALRSYRSGSLAHHTMIDPVTDGDGGLVLDRRCYPGLGPEGGGEPPTEVCDQLCALLGPEVRRTYPNARCGTSKRGPKLTFGAPIDGQDPTVDMVVALTRRDGDGLWIPNLHTNRWEASHPEGHVTLFNAGPAALRQTRRAVIRLAKAWNKQYTQPGMSSFHLSTLALEFVQPGVGVARALHTLFDRAATRIERGQATPDPAGVSAPLKLLLDRATVATRLRRAADALGDALARDDDPVAVQAALHRVFWKYVDDPHDNRLAQAAAVLRPRQPVSTTALGITGPAAMVATTRAYGGRTPR
ncbi:hypothetical protein GCM10020358_58350 [Amorphoplanes nipponensis]|uniref:Nucleotidyltransferase n=1 Tax=Actinoplanes nipponensis TaxID=135950 RepID=A0A919MPX8_9ACTN|nr:hypothetical protein [Actinoplanes nipponensis]GIE52537.1 hypothetical protein Ani05nite_60710 [Actinoplanes nipponensis]